MTGYLGSAGTAGEGYKLGPAAHEYRPDLPEYGRRPVCRECGEEHPIVPAQRRASS